MRFISAFLILLAAGAAHADDRAVAKEHYIKGTKLFELGHYDEAIKEYDLAYQAKDNPVLLYNIAQAHRLANHYKDAIFYYKAFNRKAPGNPHAEEVETKIEELSKLLRAQTRAENLNPNDPIAPKAVVTEAKPVKPAPPPAPPPVAVKPPPPAPVAKPPAPPPPAKPTVVATSQPPPPNRPIFEDGQEIPPPTTPPAEAKPRPTTPPPAAATPPPAKPANEVVKAPKPKDTTPITKKKWFWPVIGTVAGVVVISVVVGIAVGVPTDTTIVSDCRFGVGNMNCAR